MSAPPAILRLVRQFAEYESAYVGHAYKETQVRRHFIDPFFTALGWDVANKDGKSPARQDVVHEYTLDTETSRRMPDYSFRLGGIPRFFVESKKPSENLKQGVAAALQTRTYGWSAKVPVSVLTDFQEFAVYECLTEPRPSDSPQTARLKYLTWREYQERWDEIEQLLSRDALLSGSLDTHVIPHARDALSVDEAFLLEIEDWRRRLAQDLSARNPFLSQRDLNFAVQQTIDRIVFLRISEDRGIERRDQLKELAEGDPKGTGAVGLYKQLTVLFERADERYNSGLFHFRNEPGRVEPPDTLTLELEVGDEVLRHIIERLYFPRSPYQFAVLPADILGHVYEQFLGKVIRLDIEHGAVVEDKPEVRKAGGVYYTPTYVVRYIVGSVLDRLLEGETPQSIRGSGKKLKSPLRIVDPACGSGSFLIEAYQHLLDWYRDQYAADPAKWSRGRDARLHQGPNDEWLLTGAERKRILLTHIFGVDIDPQAVEVTKLSLLLKVLESESTETIMQTARLFHERALPDLGANIKRGNSLIAHDFFHRHTTSLLDEDEQFRISPFDWHTEFPTVFADGGFDAVIGNPPYLSVDDVWGKNDPRLQYLKATYPDVYRDKTDILFYFFARAIKISRREISFIVSRAFLEAYKADRLRRILASEMNVVEIVDLRNFQVFPKVGITTAIVSLTRARAPSLANVYQLVGDRLAPPIDRSLADHVGFRHIEVPQKVFGAESWSFVETSASSLNEKLDAAGEPLGTILSLGQGMQTGLNKAFAALSEEVVDKWRLPGDLYFRRARNSDIQRWRIRNSHKVVLYPEERTRFGELPPVVQGYLRSYEAELRNRAACRRGNCEWWKFTWPLHKALFHRDKIYCPYLAASNRFALDREKRFLGLTDTTVLFDDDQPEDLRYILGLLNSSVLSFRFRSIGKLKAGGVYEYFDNSLSKLPIPRVSLSSPEEGRLHDRMVKLVDNALLLTEQKMAARTEQDREIFERQLNVVERQTDELAFAAYGCTKDDRDLILKTLEDG